MDTLFDIADMQRGAIFSPCRTYRYRLWRTWDDALPMIAYVGLNPSTADENEDDNTIRRCIGFARAMGCGGMWMLNAFSFCATKPPVMWKRLKAGGDIVGPENDAHLLECTAYVPMTIVAWGANMRRRPQRAAEIQKLLSGRVLHCLRLLDDGTPEHPLMLPKTCTPQIWPSAQAERAQP